LLAPHAARDLPGENGDIPRLFIAQDAGILLRSVPIVCGAALSGGHGANDVSVAVYFIEVSVGFSRDQNASETEDSRNDNNATASAHRIRGEGNAGTLRVKHALDDDSGGWLRNGSFLFA